MLAVHAGGLLPGAGDAEQHGLEHGEGEPFLAAEEGQGVHRAVVVAQVAAGRHEGESAGDLAVGLLHQRAEQRAPADEQDLDLGGKTGGGFNQHELDRVYKLLKPLETAAPAFKVKPRTNERPHWVRPELVAQVKFTEWTDEGLLRHPIYLGYLITHVAFISANPTAWNVAILIVGDTALLLRAVCEEQTLARDASYREYQQLVRWRVCPGLF